MLNEIYSPLGRLIANGEAYKILRVDKNQLIAETLVGEHKQACFHEHQLKRLLASGDLEYHPFALANRNKKKINSHSEIVPSDLSEGVREQVDWRLAWCHAFLNLEANNALKRTDSSIKANLETMHQDALQRLVANCGRVALKNAFRPPCARTLRNWVNSYQGNPGGLNALIPQHGTKSKNVSIQISSEAEEILSSCVQLYLSRQKPSQAMIVQATKSRFKELNIERIENGKPPIHTPSESTIKRRIRAIEPYFKCLSREGASIANRKFAMYENGISAKFPGEIIQIDSWRVDLITLFGNSQQMPKLDEKQKKEITKGRRWLTLAIDSATRVVLGFRITEAPDANTSVALLEEIMRDKSDLSKAAACENDWSQKTGLGTVLTDNGSEFANSKFEGAVAEFMGDAQRPPAGLPQLRAHVERYFRTVSETLMPNLTARVFESVKQRGDYPSEDLAALYDDNLARILTNFIVDIYHQSPHAGLKGYTPVETWDELSKTMPPLSMPDLLTKIRVFGQRFERNIQGNGVQQFSITYSCPELREAFTKSPNRRVEIAVWSSNLGACAVKIDGAWFLAKANRGELDGVSIKVWSEACKEVSNRAEQNRQLHFDSIVRATKRIRDVQAQANSIESVCPVSMSSSAQSAHFESLFSSVSGHQYQSSEELPQSSELFGRRIPSKMSPADKSKLRSDAPKIPEEPAPRSSDADGKKQTKTWRLRDD